MKLSNLLQSARDISMEKSAKTDLKNRLILSVAQEELAKSYIFSEVKELKMSSQHKALVKESLFEKIESLYTRRFINFDMSMFFKRVTGSALLFVLVFGVFRDFVKEETVVFADDFTKIENFSGDVVVMRGEIMLKAYNGMELIKKDRIVTGGNGEAVISYFDESVSRLKSDTQLKITEIASFDRSKLQTYVEVEVLSGSVWTKVLNLVEDSSSFVVRADDVYAKAKKAAFNVEVQTDKTEVSVYKNNIEIHTPFAGEKVASVMTGQKVVVNSEKKLLEVKKVEKDMKADLWVVDNLKKDETYVAKIEEKVNEEKKVVVATNNEPVNLDFSDVEKEKLAFELSDKNFLEAQVKLADDTLTDEEKDALNKQIADFSDAYSEYVGFIDEVAERDSKYANNLKSDLDEKMMKYNKSLSLVLPDSPIYNAKEELKEIGYLNNVDDASLAAKKLDDTKDKLSEAEELATKGNIELATEIVKDSGIQMTEVKTLVENSKDNAPISIGIQETENMMANLENNILPEATSIRDELSEGQYGATIMGDKKLDPVFNLD